MNANGVAAELYAPLLLRLLIHRKHPKNPKRSTATGTTIATIQIPVLLLPPLLPACQIHVTNSCSNPQKNVTCIMLEFDKSYMVATHATRQMMMKQSVSVVGPPAATARQVPNAKRPMAKPWLASEWSPPRRWTTTPSRRSTAREKGIDS
uniref:Uncharacterized protein n=1 Tax=Oryza brachyantha TaxID=4533 RepID=J3MLL5_ORYBR